jgi:pimeloyl-ACP methyl ester carboxylesterase
MLNRRQTLWGLGATPLAVTAGARTASAWEGFVSIGGIEQWLSIRGASADSSVLLFLHGGPGEAMSPFASMLAPWEREFTVALWDQRGAGRTFGRNRDGQGEISLDRLTADAIEVADHLRQRLGKAKIVLVGQSWGSILGWTAVHARPDLFSAFVGTGQSVSWSRALLAQEDHARTQAKDDPEALAALDAARRLPIDDPQRGAPLRRWIMPPSDLAFLDTQRRFLGPPPLPEHGEVADWVEGFGRSAEALTPAVLAFDAYASGPEAGVPVIAIQGRDDLVTPTEVVRRFVTDLGAPAKAFATIEGGHFACYTNARGFASALAEHVRPLTDRP